MPKGDRLRLKADPEDGTTPIANLLLEAVAMAKISGLQKGAILYLWRRTYGWIEDGKRLKERKIPLTEWINALDSEKSRVSKTLSELETMRIISRRIADIWGGYYYSLNTHIKSWNSGCLNIAKLSEMITVGDFTTVVQNATVGENATIETLPTVDQTDKTTVGENATIETLPTVDQTDKTTVGENATQQLAKTTTPTLYKEILKKDIKKDIASKKAYGEFNNVLLTDTEYQKLKDKFNDSLSEKVESLSGGIASKGYKYKSHYAAILNWDRMDKKRGQNGGTGTNQQNNPRQVLKPDQYTHPEQL